MTDTLLRRPNGRPQACDPCRARKVACDHAQPVCNRCRKRNQERDCVYTVSAHAASAPASLSRDRVVKSRRPVTAGRTSSGSSPPPSSLASAQHVTHYADPASSHHHPLPTSSEGSTRLATPGSGNRQLHHHPSASSEAGSARLTAPGSGSRHHSPNRTIPPSGPGYLGFTSYSTIYKETRDSLSLLQGAPVIGSPATGTGDESTPGTTGSHAARGTSGASTLSSPTHEMCIVILRGLGDLSGRVIHPRAASNPWDRWVRIAGHRILQSFQAHLPPQPARHESKLRELADLLSRNTSTKARDDLTDPNEWIEQFSGQNVRWESLGFLFTFSELSEYDADPGLTRSEKYQAALEHVDMCIDLAMCMSGGNLMLLFLCYRRTILESSVMGDAGLSCWRAHAETISLLTFLGIHADSETDSYIPTFCSELRRRLCAYVFNLDKIVSFQGRPPLLSRHFVSTPLPLDLDDEVFFAGTESVARAVAALDQNGWNRSNIQPFATTSIRGRTMMAIMRDELMEISLGNNAQTSISTLMDLKAREADIVAAFPPSIRQNPHDLENPALDIEAVYLKMLITLEHLQNLFFIERLLLRRGHPDNGDLLLNSFEMVTLTLTFWMHKDRFSNIRRDFEWLVMSYAAPGGGILCMELLKPTFAGPHPLNPAVSRSSIVQQLSLLVGFLGWVSPDAPNADLCANCKTVIQHVLDHTLNGGGAGGGMPDMRSEPLEALEQFDATQLYFNFDLLDTFDWLRADEMPYFS